MSLDFGKLNAGIAAKQTDPRKIFTTLKRDTRFKRPLDEQADVLDEWYSRRTSKDLTIKMNTGGGKTAVGLLCLQSSLNERILPAVFVTPDSFLVTQVLAEAKQLGIAATDDEKDPDFISGQAVLVINVHKLFNARSVFGVGVRKIEIGAIVIDDAHACLGVVQQQFSIRAAQGSAVYDDLLDLFEADLRAQSPSGLLDIQAKEQSVVMMAPYWAWQKKQDAVLKLLHRERDSEELEWSWPLLSESIPLCNCVFGGGKLEITPHFIPIDRIPAFSAAKRRIYMTATLADDTILVSHFKADPNNLRQPIRPKGGGDIGDRMILAPQEINPDFTLDEIRDMVAKISATRNVVVIVPSKARSVFWKGVAQQTLDKDTIEKGVEHLRRGHVGLTVLINKYDGVDLPGEACELLVIDGLPEVYGLTERMEMAILDGTKRQLVRQVQRIEQGMGRGVRSSDDHCVVLLLGARLTQRLHQPEADGMFSAATRAQIALGKAVADQARGKPLKRLEEIMSLCLEQDDNWVAAGRNAVVNAEPAGEAHLDENQVRLREAFDAALLTKHDQAIVYAQSAVKLIDDLQLRGYLKQQLAEHTNFVDPAKAQELQIAALDDNHRLLKPIKGASYKNLSAPASGQAAAAVAFMNQFIDGNELVIWANGLIEDLDWREEASNLFASAIKDLGQFLGFGSERPKEKLGKGPSNLWALGGLQYLIIECKGGAADAKQISQQDASQLNSCIVWFEQQYDQSCSATPVMVHPKTSFENSASPHASIRILNSSGLRNLREAIRGYAIALATDDAFTDVTAVQKQLQFHKLVPNRIVGMCTVDRSFN